MEDIVERLRGFKSAAAQSWAHEAADEIESLRAQLANEKRAATEIYQALENSRAQLAEAKKELEEANETASNNFAAVQEIDLWLIQHDMLKITHEGGGEAAGLNVVDALENMHQQLLATQAHAATMKEALKLIKNFSKSPYVVSTATAALSSPNPAARGWKLADGCASFD